MSDTPSWYHDPTKENEARRQADQQRAEDFRREQNAEARDRADRKEKELSDRRPFIGSGGTRPVSSAAPPAAKVAIAIGWLSLIAALLSLLSGFDYSILGLSFPVFALLIGVLGLAIGYAPERVAGLLGLGGLVMVYLGGQTAEGFQLKAVSLQTWGVFAFILLVGLVIAKLFGR